MTGDDEAVFKKFWGRIDGDDIPLPPPDAEVISTACDYCIVACGYKVYRWPVKGGKTGGAKGSENAFGVDFPVDPLHDTRTERTWSRSG